jgi:hypothetical protein
VHVCDVRRHRVVLVLVRLRQVRGRGAATAEVVRRGRAAIGDRGRAVLEVIRLVLRVKRLPNE